MAIDFDNDNGAANTATYTHLELDELAVTAPPFTFFAWINPAAIGSVGATIISVTRMPVTGFGGTTYYSLGIANDSRVFMSCGGPLGPTPVIAYSGSTISLGSWHSVAGVVASYTSNICYLDGVAGTEETATSGDLAPFLALGSTLIGAAATVNNGVYAAPYIGCQGYVYIWDGIALSSAQIALLHAGAPPTSVAQGAQVVALDMLTEATAGSNGAGNDFTVFDPASLMGQCPDAPPLVSGGSSYVRIMG